MEKTITTALLVIASIVAAVALINALIPAAGKGSGALVAANEVAANRIKTDVEIVFATGNTGDSKIIFWAKNVGSNTIQPIEESDIFLTTPTTIQRIPYGAPSGTPYWDYVIEDGASAWTQAATVKVTLNMVSVATGLHQVTITVYNAVSTEKDFSI